MSAQRPAAGGTRELAERPLRLAMFSPVPPTPSGIAAYLADLLPLLPPAWSIDVFTDPLEVGEASLPRRDASGPPACFAHTEFEHRHGHTPYELTVYQVGNSTQRTWMLDYVLRYPGLLVLHDGVLHPARVSAATAAGDLQAYRRMARVCRDDVGAAIGHLVAGGLGGPALYFTYPMCEDLVRASKATAMHGELSCDWLRRQVPHARAMPLAHWRAVDVDGERRDAWRSRLARRGEVLIGSFGNIGAERRLDRVLRALAAVARGDDGGYDAAGHTGDGHGTRSGTGLASWRMVVAGRVDERLGLDELVTELGLARRVDWQPALGDDDFVALMAAVDFAVNLRYPPARSSSGVLHQLLQLGVPALISDVVHWRDYPGTAVARIPPGPDAAEHAALCAALRRWIDDGAARAAAASAAATWAARHVTPTAMRNSYLEAVAAALVA